MKITNINKLWGSMVECTIDEALSCSVQFWKELGYSRDLILIRGLGKISDADHYALVSKFGTPWSADDYKHSNEVIYEFELNGLTVCTTKFSNKLSKLGGVKMPWHVDIPNFNNKSFPWRSLYNIENPNPLGGLTSWVNVRLDHINPTKEDIEYYNRLSVLNQSWHGSADSSLTNLQRYVKKHIITDVESLRSNYFISKDSSPKAWIKEVYLDDIKVDNMQTLGPIHKYLSSTPGLTYTHSWEQYDFIIYDNWNLMHRRTNLNITNGGERLFFRTNIHHV